MCKLISYLFLSITLLLTACGDDDSSPNPVPASSIYEDQDLQGTVFGQSWIFKSGALVSINGGINPGNNLHILTIRSEPDTNICAKTNNGISNLSLIGERYLGIFIETDKELLETGVYAFADAGSFGDAAFYFYDSTAVNSVSQVGTTSGSMLITRIDTEAGVVEGSLIANDEEFNTNSSVNGKFIVDYCRP